VEGKPRSREENLANINHVGIAATSAKKTPLTREYKLSGTQQANDF
jgi:hypothetical protein